MFIPLSLLFSFPALLEMQCLGVEMQFVTLSSDYSLFESKALSGKWPSSWCQGDVGVTDDQAGERTPPEVAGRAVTCAASGTGSPRRLSS